MNTVAPILASRGRIATGVQQIADELRKARSRQGPGVLTSVYGSGTTQRVNRFTFRGSNNTNTAAIPTWG